MNSKRKSNKQRKGFTLVELIVTIAILGILITAIFQFFFFNLDAYDRGDSRSGVQFDVRMATDFVSNEIRNAQTISTTDTTLAATIDSSDLSDQYSSVSSVTFEILHEDGRYFVVYDIQGEDPDGGSQYALSTRVLLNNITSAVEDTGNTLYYSK